MKRNLHTNDESYSQYFVKYLWWKIHTLSSTITCFFNTSNYGFCLCALCPSSKGEGIHFRGWVAVASQQDVVRLPDSWSQRSRVKKVCRSIYTKISHLNLRVLTQKCQTVWTVRPSHEVLTCYFWTYDDVLVLNLRSCFGETDRVKAKELEM